MKNGKKCIDGLKLTMKLKDYTKYLSLRNNKNSIICLQCRIR